MLNLKEASKVYKPPLSKKRVLKMKVVAAISRQKLRQNLNNQSRIKSQQLSLKKRETKKL